MTERVKIGPPHSWLALVIGNSRLHWALVEADRLHTWNTPHLPSDPVSLDPLQIHLTLNDLLNRIEELPIERQSDAGPFPHPDLPSALRSQLPLWIASVVPSQTAFWQAYPQTRLLTLRDIPLREMYPTLGIDRALAVWGIADRFGLPALAIDAGTALTLTGVDPLGNLVGGAILPGLGLQIRSLAHHTAALPAIQPQFIPDLPYWGRTTPDSITSGILHTLIAGLQTFITDWLQTYPNSTVVLTGGDATLLFQYLQHHWQHRFPELLSQVHADENLVFWGMRAIVQQANSSSAEVKA
ncbi:pantothenate kinase [Egbenema bharatensis]|uniref:pantothenate kinase n=1 Tax=Egbenema bharatensis TaxID=3463334 RepID=UPI003A879A20